MNINSEKIGGHHRYGPLTVTAVIIRILVGAGLVWLVFH